MKKGVIYAGYAVVLIIIALYALSTAAAQEGIIFEIDKENSFVVDNTTGKTWTLNEFGKEGKLFENHVVEFNLSLNRVREPPDWRSWDPYVLQLSSDIKNCRWKYDGKSYEGCRATVWDSRIDHYKQGINIVLMGRVPDVIKYGVEEPYFEGYDLKGISKKPLYADLTVYDTQKNENVHTVNIPFFSTTQSLVDIREEIEDGLATAHNAGVEYPSEEIIDNLLEKGHPGWAYVFYKSLNIPTKERFEEVKKEISENKKRVNENGTIYPEVEDAIWNEYKRGNLDSALALSVWYENQIPHHEPDRIPWWEILVSGILIGAIVGGISYHFLTRKGEEDRRKEIENLKKELSEKVKGSKEKIEECIKGVSNTDKRSKLRKIKNDLEDVENRLGKMR